MSIFKGEDAKKLKNQYLKTSFCCSLKIKTEPESIPFVVYFLNKGTRNGQESKIQASRIIICLSVSRNLHF